MNKIILNNYTCSKCRWSIKNINIDYINGIEYKNKAVYSIICKNCNEKYYFTVKRKRYYYLDKDRTLSVKDIIIPVQQLLNELKKKREKELMNIKRKVKELKNNGL